MTEPHEPTAATPVANDERAVHGSDRAASDAVARSHGDAAFDPTQGCPFLIAESGAWRMSAPAREHRCAAFAPATSLAPAKQARLCLTARHVTCATYLASLAARNARIGSGTAPDRAGRWALARMTPVVEDVGGARALLAALVADRRTWPAIPAVLLVTLLLALGLSGGGTSPVTAVGSPTPGTHPGTSAEPTLRATPPATPGATGSEPTATPPAPPTAALTPTPAATFRTTYRVVAGDTLSGIATKFHTTVKAISELNGLTSTNLRIGQILKIP